MCRQQATTLCFISMQDFLHKAGLNEKNVLTVLSGLKEVRSPLCCHMLKCVCSITQEQHLALFIPMCAVERKHRLQLLQVLGNDGLATLSFREFLLVYPWLASTVEALGARLPQTR